MTIHLFSQFNRLARGFSYWKVKLGSGTTRSELDMSFDLVRGTRPLEWLEDIIGSGDLQHVQELTLCTPKGNATFAINEPYTAFQFKIGFVPLLGGERTVNAQIVGRVENKETGLCRATIWDVVEQKLYIDYMTSVLAFKAWRPGLADIGRLNLDALDLRGIG